MHDQSDEVIAHQVQHGDSESFALLVERYEQKIRRYIKKFLYSYEDTQDTTQEVFLKAFENIQQFDAKKRFSPWLYRIAHNTAINIIKKKAREPLPFFDADTLFPHPMAKEQSDKQAITHELADAMKTCLNTLKPTYREPIILYFFEDMSYEQISDIMHIPVTTVGVRITRAKKQLKKMYEKR